MFFVVYYFYLEVFYYEGFDDMSFYVWMHQCFNTYVLILLFYGVLNVWLIVDLQRFILIIEHSLSTCPSRVRHVRKCAKRSMAW